MKHTARMTELIGFLLFAAALLYTGAFAFRKILCPTRTAGVTAAEISFAVRAEGILLRRETVLTAPDTALALTAREGAKVAAGFCLGEGLFAPVSGVFSAFTDGLEYLSPADLTPLTPERVEALAASEPRLPAGACGKLVTDIRWYYAAVTEDSVGFSPGDTVTLVPEGADEIPAEVFAVGEPVDGRTALVLRCGTCLAETLRLRGAAAEIRTDCISGLSVPTKALQTDGDGQAFVWAVTAMRLERKDVTVLCSDGDRALVRGTGGADTLREGNTVVTKGNNLYEGKVMN